MDENLLFDYSSSSVKLRFAQQSADNAMWAPILEKAWAKIKGSYGQIEAGFVINGLRALTGAPVFNYKVSNLQSTHNLNAAQTFDLIKAGENANYPMGASTTGSSDQVFNDCGIAKGHAYSMISAFTMTDASGTIHKMILMRNPWGTTYYSGTWNKDDSNWT